MKIQSSKTNRKTNKNKISDMQDMISSSKQNPRASLLRERKIKSIFFLFICKNQTLGLFVGGGGDRQMMTGVKTIAHPSYWWEYLLSDASAQTVLVDFK